MFVNEIMYWNIKINTWTYWCINLKNQYLLNYAQLNEVKIFE